MKLRVAHHTTPTPEAAAAVRLMAAGQTPVKSGKKGSYDRQVQWAREAKERLRAELGGKCVICGTTSSLEFDCIVPRGHKHHVSGSVHRICFYRAEARSGNVQLLCSACHSKKTYKDCSAQPF